MYSTSSCQWVVGEGGVRTTQGATVFVCRRVVGGGGARTTTGPQSLFVQLRRNKEKGIQIGCSRGGVRTTTGPQSLFVG